MKQFICDLKREFHGYNSAKLLKDLMAGLTVAAVALPLALAFGVSSGADAASGMITAIFAGIIIGLLSGASYQISGPTGAMAAILISVSAKYGLQGVLTAGLLSGLLLLIMALLKVGKLVSFIPVPVITGFTSGIAIIIALGQVDNFFGTTSKGENALAKLWSYTYLGFHPNKMALLFGILTIAIMLLYPKKWSNYLPASLIAIVIAVIVNFIINPNASTSSVAEVGAIPQTLITKHSLLLTGIDFDHLMTLLEPAFSIAALGLIESLLCGASAGTMKGERLNSTRELVAQGIGNILIPLFGGIPATAAIARTSVVIKSGGQTRLASVFHSITLLLSMFLLGGIMSRIPLAALAGVLIVTAYKMNDWGEIRELFSKKLTQSIIQFLCTMIATVVFDLAIAIVIGILVAMFIFILRSCNLRIAISDIDESKLTEKNQLHKHIKVLYLTGPLFFGTQEQLTHTVDTLDNMKAIVFSMRGVPSIDRSAIHELELLVQRFRSSNTQIVFSAVQDDVKTTMEHAGFVDFVGEEWFVWDTVSAIKKLDHDLNIIDTPQTK